ncbi:MAG TPA: HupE/UreJ family protein [Vicinamibacterales bacterium]|jgi:hydrogenase/urease accessory protein HupE
MLITVAWLALTGTIVRAHDPGLSSLDVTVRGDVIAATLSMAESDLASMAPRRGAETSQALRVLAREAVLLFVDDEWIPSTETDVAIVEGGARVLLSFAIPRSISGNPRVTIRSDVPKRLARGHRELLTIRTNGAVTTERMFDAAADSVTLDLAAAPSQVQRVRSFFVFGVRHILTGYDHLVFLAGLLLAASTLRELVVALTAFTIAHSISLALVAVGGVHAPPSIVEPLIAASIAWIGIENLLRHRPRPRWFLVFGVGLIHGFGFAGALIELGFGSSIADVATALISFNGGVEAGQLAAAATMLPLVSAIRSRPEWQARLRPVCSLLIALAGGYWLLQRLP